MADHIDLRKLPPLKALKGFEAATRLQSIGEAADELCLTHPAVSHQVQQIEEALGVALFSQDGRYIASTEEGRIFYPYVRAAFLSLIEGIEATHRHAHNKSLRVHSYVTVSIRWLAHRLSSFTRFHPDIKLVLKTCGEAWRFEDVHSDVGLVYCDVAPDSRFHWVPLFDCALFPVCGPRLAAKIGPDGTVQDLLDHPLVTISTEFRHWELWFEAAGIPFKPTIPYITVDTLALALEVAMDNEAIVLVNGPFVDEELASGRQVRPVDHRAVLPGAWGLICRKEVQENYRIRSFIAWLQQSVGGDQKL